MNLYSVIKRPILSEKSTLLRDEQNKYSFEVQLGADKTQVKSAVEKVFDVKVTSVNTSITRGKLKRRGMHVSLSKKRKKAVVQLAAGQSIKLFEDQ